MKIKWNEYTWYSKLIAAIFFILVLPTWTFYLGMKYQEAIAVIESSNTGGAGLDYVKKEENTTPSTSAYSLKLNENQTILSIYEKGKLIKTISNKDIPVFDGNHESDFSNPAVDYFFYWWGDNENNNVVFDSLRGRIYINVLNRTTAGNANASHGLFAYNIATQKLELVTTFFGTGGDAVAISGDSAFLVTQRGSHGGACANGSYLEIINLENNKTAGRVESTLFTDNGTGFQKWIDNRTFEYNEWGFRSAGACSADGGEQSEAYFKESVKSHTIK